MSTLWQTKLAAWLHDPAEKALVLLRDRAGHEGGTVRQLKAELATLLVGADQAAVRTGDWWAAAADRPNFPAAEGENLRTASWAQVRFANTPVLIHPLSGESFNLGEFKDAHVESLKAVSFDHFGELIALGGGDPRLTYLAFWRFGPETPAEELDKLWQMLPADTRVPDHTIWNHLDMVSALAGAQSGDAPALLAMSFGPVQGFITQARSTSDLWAGSHLLSSLVWEGLKVIAGEIGPDAVVFPQLRGLAAVDAWLHEQAASAGLSLQWEEKLREAQPGLFESASDANPLFAAALPNKFLAIVPKSRARDLARRIEGAVRAAARAWAEEAARRVMDGADGHWQGQIPCQLEGFPEVHWAIADWPGAASGKVSPEDTASLREALDGFVPEGEGFFAAAGWKTLSREIEVEGARFFMPNPGILYPAVFDLAERALAASKTLRPFAQRRQEGYRCTLCGEREWLALEAGWLAQHERATLVGNPWAKLAAERRHGIKQGEHLCAICALKRLWPALFAERVGRQTGASVGRYVVSTHTMALATTLERLAQSENAAELAQLQAMDGVLAKQERVALPRKLHRQLLRHACGEALRRLPAAFDAARETQGENGDGEHTYEELARRVRQLGGGIETYYGLILMDGDRMGAWLSGEDDFATTFRESWHPQVRAAVDNRFRGHDALQAYLGEQRPPSPGRHAAISQALNDFSSRLAPHIVEDLCKGKLIYAGGDDALAMVAVDDLARAMLLLRLAYSGIGMGDLEQIAGRIGTDLRLANGFGVLDGKLMRLMGGRATASMGAVIAHHQAPLGAVLRALRQAEGWAKGAGRSAFCLRVVKRGGGETGFIAPWWLGAEAPAAIGATPIGLLLRVADALAAGGGEEKGKGEGEGEGMSRRAAYLAREWLIRLPAWPGAGRDADWQAMTANRLGTQFSRQGGDPQLADDLVAVASALAAAGARGHRQQLEADNDLPDPRAILDDLISTAEFLAREVRAAEREAA